MIGTLVIIVTVPAMAPSHNSAKWVFTEFKNTTGYENDGMVFLIGLVSVDIYFKLSIIVNNIYIYIFVFILALCRLGFR